MSADIDRSTLPRRLARLADQVEREAEHIRLVNETGNLVRPCETLGDLIWALRAAAAELQGIQLFVHPLLGD